MNFDELADLFDPMSEPEQIGLIVDRVMPVRIVVDGEVVAAARPRFARVGNFVKTYNPAHVMQYRERLQAAASEAMQGRKPLDGALSMTVKCYMPIPAAMSKQQKRLAVLSVLFHTKKPDCSNLLKNIEDALNNIVYVDDARLARVEVTKIYGEKPRVEVEVSVIPRT